MNILVCIDGTKKSENVVRYTGKIAKILNAQVTVLYVSKKHHSLFEGSIRYLRTQSHDWGIMRPGAVHLKNAYNILKEVGVRQESSPESIEILNETGEGAYDLVTASCILRGINLRLRDGKVAEEILKETETGKYDYDLVVLGAPEFKGIGKAIFSSVSHGVAEKAKIPVVIAPKIIYEPMRILICSDGSDAITLAVERIKDKLGMLKPDSVTVLSVAPDEKEMDEYVRVAEQTADILKGSGLDVKTKVRSGKIAQEILSEAKDYSLVLVCSHRLSHEKILLGSVSSYIITHSEVPTLIMR